MSEIDELREKITERDNLLDAMGIHLPDSPPARWEYMHRPWKTVTTSGVLRCPNCKGVFHRIVGVWYKHCPECGKRLAMREECV